jgi:hypothetical protein
VHLKQLIPLTALFLCAAAGVTEAGAGSPASVTLANPVFGEFNVLTMELGGTTPGTGHDHLNVTGTATLGGTLHVLLINEFTPALGNSFNLFDGTTTGGFSTVTLPPLAEGLVWNTSQLASAGVIAIASATPPEIEVKGGSVSIADGSTTPSTLDGTDFGHADVSNGVVLRPFTIDNFGTGALALTGVPRVAVSGPHAADFLVTVQPPSTVPAAGSTTFQVAFDPAAAGIRLATLTIANDDSDEGLYDFAIQGVGTVSLLPATRVGDALELRWPVDGTDGFKLQSSVTLGATADWQDVTELELTVVDGVNKASVPIGTGERFYRLLLLVPN